MDPDRWDAVKHLFHVALDLPPQQRSAYLDQSCTADAALRHEVESLLASHDSGPAALDRPVWETANLSDGYWIGRRVAHYEVGPEIGRGGMGVVHAAHDTELDRPVALKFLSAQFAGNAAFLDRFRREARAASALNHPNVCTVYSIGDFAGHPFIAMELLEGQSLKDRLAQGPLPTSEALACALQIADALDAAHAAGIVHRDIKPANIFLTARGSVKVLDFGLAQTERDASHTGLAVGTIAYMSPEQARGEPLDSRTDIFSFGVLLSEMAAPPAFQRVIRKATGKDRRRRYQTISSLRSDLKRSRLRIPVGVALAALALLAVLLIYWRPGAQKPLSSVAILPLDNTAHDAAVDYLIDGIGESLIQKLSELRRLRVMARSTVLGYRGKTVDPRQAGKDLRVDAILTGRVVERGSLLSIQMELVSARDGTRLWGAQYDRSPAELQAAQEEIASQIAAGLGLQLTEAEQKRLARRDTQDSRAYRLYTEGRYHWNKRNAGGFQKAIDLFQQAVALDPNFALAYAGLADCYILLNSYGFMSEREASGKAEAAARHALQIDPALAEAHTSLAFVLGMHQWKFADAEAEYRQAVQLNPSYATAHQWYALFLTAMGRRPEALSEIRKAVDLAPVSLIIRSDYALVLMMTGHYDEAVRECRRTLEMDPNFTTAHWYLGQIYTEQHAYEDAIRELQIGANSTFGEPSTAARFGYAYALWGKRPDALRMAAVLEKSFPANPGATCGLSIIYSALGERERGLDWLEKAAAVHAGCLVWVKGSEEYDNVRALPRFRELLQRIGFTP